MLFDKLADKVINNPKQIIIAWIVIILCAAPLAISAGDVLKYDMQEVAVDESESVIGLTMIADVFHSPEISMADNPLLVLQTDAPYGDAEKGFQAFESLLKGKLGSFVDDDGNQKILEMIYPGMLTEAPDNSNGNGALAVVNIVYSPDFKDVQGDTSELREFVSSVLSEYALTEDALKITTYVTGTGAMMYDVEIGVVEDLSKIEPVTIVLILVLIGLFFRSVISATTPPITIGFAFGVTLAVVFLLGAVMDIFFITQMLILVTMMGAGCDYCIFILARYKEERRTGAEHETALRNSVVWAGESIATSGATVIIGFGSISLFSVPMMSTMGIVLAIGILIALIAALTLITSLISIFGDRMFWPSNAETFKKGSKAMDGWYGKFARLGERYFKGSARFSQKRAGAITLAAVLITVPALYVVSTAETSYDFMGTLSTGESYDGLQEIEDSVGGGFLQPNYVLIEFEDSIADVTFTHGVPSITWDANNVNHITSLTSQISPGQLDNIASANGIVMWDDVLTVAKAEYVEIMANLDIDPVEMLPLLPHLQIIESHAVAGLTLKNMPTESMPYALGAMEAMNLEWSFLETLNVMMSGGSVNDVVVAATEYETKYPNDAERFKMISMENPVSENIMNYAINYLGGILGGEETETGLTLNYVKLSAITVASATSIKSMGTVADITEIVDAFAAETEGVVGTWITGMPAVTYDLSNSVTDEFVYVGLIVVLLILLLLFFVMKSYTIPFRSLITIGMSVIWTIALTHIVFTGILGIDVIWMVPMILFVVCLGLGMDYDILLTTRIKENAMFHGMDNDTAINEAVISTDSDITICGLIMAGAFGTLMLSSMPMMQEFGFSLCVAILIDALIVRTYLVPAVMHLLGKWNWVGPKWLQRGSRRIQ